MGFFHCTGAAAVRRIWSELPGACEEVHAGKQNFLLSQAARRRQKIDERTGGSRPGVAAGPGASHQIPFELRGLRS